ncbi:MAG: type II toxin-antitoxin system VapC family toxin [Acidobacteria bacterium]|nr:type II toxin-antitoxin system VapC family toxin [Acidobacteriota bacterium]
MNLLLDTHTFLWFAVASLGKSLPEPTRELLEDKSNRIYLSSASPWEVAIKVSIGKLQLPQSIRQIVQTEINNNDLILLDIGLAHLDLVERLPFHHKDPFDRLLIAQAEVEGFTIVGVDAAFDAYGVNRLWLR